MNRKENHGLYTPELEKDSCGIGMIANLNGIKSNSVVDNALTILENMEHRGACGYEVNTGDGAGILTQIPHHFFSKVLKSEGITLPAAGKYGVGFLFLPKDNDLKEKCKAITNRLAKERGFNVIYYRSVPRDNSELGLSALKVEPDMEQVFLEFEKSDLSPLDLDRKLYLLRKNLIHTVLKAYPELADFYYFTSISSRTIVYKGQLTASQLRTYYADLADPDYTSAISLVHSRFSTNTVPKWKLAQPFRLIAHNGEINTIRSNKNNFSAREKNLGSDVYSDEELESIKPVCADKHSDSGNFDNVIEFLYMNGRSIPHAMMMMIPEAWHSNPLADAEKKSFYDFHESMMEPWDGPASICFSNGTLVGATLDRNGLRPSRYVLTEDNVLILASEVGVLPVKQETIVYKGRLQPGKILIADLDEKKIIGDDELKKIICGREEYGKWIKNNTIKINKLEKVKYQNKELSRMSEINYCLAQGFSREDIDVILGSMATTGKEPIGSMGADIPIPVLSKVAQHIANYFKQEFAQVTNPPIDPLRERTYMSLHTFLGPTIRLHDSINSKAFQIKLDSPILSEDQFATIVKSGSGFLKTAKIACHFKSNEENGILRARLKQICKKAEKEVNKGARILIVSNREIAFDKAAIPSLLSVGAIHQHLIKKGLRKDVSILVEGGDLLETHHSATLLSFGADAIFPFLAYRIVRTHLGGADDKLVYNYKKAVEKGLLKVMSKLGISTVSSYKGAQTFEALGIDQSVVDVCFTNTITRIGGMTFDMLAREQLAKHRVAFDHEINQLPDLGNYQWKAYGEYHLFNPDTIHLLQYSTSRGDYNIFKKYTAAINKNSEKACTLRSFFTFRKDVTPIDISEVESVEKIMKRFATGAMSFGSISYEAHTTLAKAMNLIGGKSNSGEGGEDEIRYTPDEEGYNLQSAIKQVASGRFGVTINYLNHANEIQIKMAQGAKPGEGGQLPGHKVDEWIGKVRHSTPGVGLISPPPHHDIYSIEDLAQLIFDLKNANPEARISVKLVSKAGVGIIASGVAKAHADHILISGADGGTGASPLSSIRHAGLPWELGLSETHQTLVKNKLRDRVTVQADGQMRTGKDMAIATMLGAEEWGIATAALVVEGCILMRKCHLNTCPVGIATQDPKLREKFEGKVEHLVNFFRFLAQDLREIMASVGVRTVSELVGRADLLKVRDNLDHWKWQNVDFEKILFIQDNPDELPLYKCRAQDHGIDQILDKKLIKYSTLAIKDNIAINSVFDVVSTDRAVGTMLSHFITKKYGGGGMPEDSISFRFRGSAGQSFGAFATKGLTLTLEGDTNDYLGKGLSGAKLIIVPDRDARIVPSENIIAGNVALYGATSGEVYIRGIAGDRFGVRNSGAIAVVEGTGDNACEYMTGGRVVILGEVGRNFSAGMSGGIAWIYNPKDEFFQTCNKEMVSLEKSSESDLEEVRKYIRDHFNYTGSITALKILTNWEKEAGKFLKVIPIEYKNALMRDQKINLGQKKGSKLIKKI